MIYIILILFNFIPNPKIQEEVVLPLAETVNKYYYKFENKPEGYIVCRINGDCGICLKRIHYYDFKLKERFKGADIIYWILATENKHFVDSIYPNISFQRDYNTIIDTNNILIRSYPQLGNAEIIRFSANDSLLWSGSIDEKKE